MQTGVSPRISVVIPVLNEAETLPQLLASLAVARERGVEIVVVDGGSEDTTAAGARPLCDVLCLGPRGRAAQMNLGADRSRGTILLFVHADSRLPDAFDSMIEQTLGTGAPGWGRFDIRLDAPGWAYRLIEFMMNWRSRITHIATGDQCVFVARALFDEVGGFPDIPLMEDIALSRRLKRRSPARRITTAATTSARRWQQHGVMKTVVLMWVLRAAYAVGVAPHCLHRIYYGESNE